MEFGADWVQLRFRGSYRSGSGPGTWRSGSDLCASAAGWCGPSRFAAMLRQDPSRISAAMTEEDRAASCRCCSPLRNALSPAWSLGTSRPCAGLHGPLRSLWFQLYFCLSTFCYYLSICHFKGAGRQLFRPIGARFPSSWFEVKIGHTPKKHLSTIAFLWKQNTEKITKNKNNAN